MTFHEAVKILELGSTAVDDSAIRKAYRKKVKEYHPDSSGNPDAGKFILVKEAYDFLVNRKYMEAGYSQYKQTYSPPSKQDTGKKEYKKHYSSDYDFLKGKRLEQSMKYMRRSIFLFTVAAVIFVLAFTENANGFPDYRMLFIVSLLSVAFFLLLEYFNYKMNRLRKRVFYTKYECGSCGYGFYGTPAKCPGCGKKLNYNFK